MAKIPCLHFLDDPLSTGPRRLLQGLVLSTILALSACVSGSADQLGAGLQTNASIAPTPLTPEQIKAENQKIAAAKAARIKAANAATAARIVEPDAAKRTATVAPSANQPAKSGNFPTFGQNPTAQTVQLSKSDAEKLREELLAAGAKAEAAVPVQTVETSQTDMEKLQAEAATHGEAKLKKIVAE